MRMQEITAEQYLAILNSGGDALASSVKLNKRQQQHELGRTLWDKKYRSENWQWWVGDSSMFKYFYTAVE